MTFNFTPKETLNLGVILSYVAGGEPVPDYYQEQAMALYKKVNGEVQELVDEYARAHKEWEASQANTIKLQCEQDESNLYPGNMGEESSAPTSI